MGSLRITLTPTGTNPNVGDLYLDDAGQLEWIGLDIADHESYALMVLQRIRCRIMHVRGEWYLDQRQGTPWREKTWVKGVTEDTVKSIVREVIGFVAHRFDLTPAPLQVNLAREDAIHLYISPHYHTD